MKVALNCTCFNDRPSGAKQRFLGIYRNLATRMPQTEFVIFEPSDCRMEMWFKGISNIQIRPTPIPSQGRVGKLVKNALYWSRTLSNEKFDVFEGFHLPLPVVHAGKMLLTIHDIRSSRNDQSWLGRMIFRYIFGRALKRADVVITVSEAMKQEVLPYCTKTSIHVIPNGIAPSYSETIIGANLQAFQEKFGLPDTFMLAVGHLEQRKNYPNLVYAIDRLRTKGIFTHLVIVGNDSGSGLNLREIIAECGLKNQVTIIGGLSDVEVRYAYELCNLFIFPSIYEGFGIPILEAMAAARPMVISDIPVFREITEGRGAYFHPEDPNDIARAIGKVLSSQQEQRRLIEYGKERVRAYSYTTIVEQYKQLYDEILGDGTVKSSGTSEGDSAKQNVAL